MAQFLNIVLRDATPIVLVALGGLFAFRAGIFHLGLEGLMILGAFTSVALTRETDSVVVGVVAAVGVCVVVESLFWLLVVPLRADPIIAGLGLTTFCLGATTFGLQAFFGEPGAIRSEAGLPRPVTDVQSGAGVIFSDLSIVVWVLPLICVGAWFVLRRTRFGLQLAAAGEHPFAASSAGVSVARTRLVALLITGVFCALGGADLALGGLNSFSQGMTNGRGYIAIAAIIFGGIGAVGTPVAAFFFGFADAVGIQAQISDFDAIPLSFILMVPYVVTIVAVVITGILRRDATQAAANYSELRY